MYLRHVVSESNSMGLNLFTIVRYNIRNPQFIGINVNLADSVPF